MIQDSMTIPSQDIDRTLTAWLGGIIDGEGSLTFWKVKNRENCYMFGITVVNTDLGILNQIEHIYAKLGIPSKINAKSQSNSTFVSKKQCWEIIIRKRDYIKKTLMLIIPYIFGNKKEKAIRMLEYMELHPKYTRTKKDFFCEYCNHLITNRGKRFCSQKCWHKKAVGTSNPNWRHGKFISGVETER